MIVLALTDPCQTRLQGQICLLLEQASKIRISPSDLVLRPRVSELR